MTLAEEVRAEIGKVRHAIERLRNIHDRVQGPGTGSAFTQVYLRTAANALRLAAASLQDAVSWAEDDGPASHEDFR